MSKTERWGVYEVALEGPRDGNPFLDVEVTADFSYKHRSVTVDGFYDGDGVYRLRFSPDTVGEWSYVTNSNVPELDGKRGTFACVQPHDGNHGPVNVAKQYHFAYADGTPYWQMGTTCYAWNHQGDDLEEQTLQTLAKAPFNKMRMCVFPKSYDYNRNEPEHYPFEGSLEHGFDFTRPNPVSFRHLEQRVQDLQKLGIQADLILFHSYDRWGFADMGEEADDRYLKYVVARLAAFSNIWWSFANEYDLMENKTMQDWDRFFKIVQENDPYQRLRSIHNCRGFYDHGKPWVTHCSIQRPNLDQVAEWRKTYGKPVVVDECCYEGNIDHGWGNITAQEMSHRFWEGTIHGGYVGHGETYCHPEDTLWWSKGGVLHGESPERIAFLVKIMEEGPHGLDHFKLNWDAPCLGQHGEYYLLYFGIKQPAFKKLALPEDGEFTVEIIDTWNMTITKLDGEYSGEIRVDLPAKQYIAVRIRRV